MGNLNCSYFLNELAATFIPGSEKVEYNRTYFREEYQRRNIDTAFKFISIKIKVNENLFN